MKMKKLPSVSRQHLLDPPRNNNNYPTRATTNWLIMLIFCWLTLLSPLVTGYNIDLPSYTKHQRLESNTMFGFSIALHKGRSGPHTNSLVVGAPKFDTSSYQEGVVEAGAVFNCGMNDGDCNLVKFDSSSNNRNTHGDVIDRKSYQWLGATVATSRDNDLIVACAPRYVFHTITPKKNLRWDPIGTCFTTRNFTHFNEVSPCRTNNWGYHRQGYCQAGFSAAASGGGDRLYVGAPGSWYWQGQAYSVSPDATFPYKPPFYQPFGTGGQTYSYDVTRPENQVYSTAESSSSDDDSYLGYSMVTGDFNGDRAEDIAIGMPRGAGLLGKIVVNKWNMVNIFNITGRQIGEYFGYAMTTCDVDGDGLDDLIIGAPMYSEPGNAEGKYDVGRVYILLQTSTNDATRWSTEHIRDGFNTKGRFGLSLTTLGDINRDGYGDFAVGAPYDGPFGRGIVYVFHGSANGPLLKPSQIIKSEDIVDGVPYPRTFGFALSGGLDMDGNTYPDLAVGAYASDQVFIFKSRPVAAVNAMTSFTSPSKLINIDEKHCQTVRDGKPVACTDITTCWSYTGEYLPNVLEFDVSWVLDAKKPKNPRMFFLTDEGHNIRNMSITLAFGKNFCRNETVYLIDNVQDKLTPLEVETRYNLHSSARPANVVRRKRDALEPVIDQNREIVQRDAINIQKNCGADNICEPDLRLEIKTVDKYLLGSREPLSIEVLISNMNEDAFEAAFYMVMPKDLDFKKIQQIGDKTDTPITCTAPSETNNYTLKCDIGNPLQSKKVANFRVVMLPSHKVGMAPSYDFFMEANSTNIEKAGSHFDNVIRKSISIWVETDLAIDGTSVPDFALYKASDYQSIENATKEEDLGPQVVHLYNIFNKGPSTIDEAIVFIHYPYQTAGGDYLMYMTNQPETHGNIQCDPHINVNALNLQLDQNLVRKSYLEERGAVIRTHGVYEGFSSSSSSSTGRSGVYIEKSHGQNQAGANAVSISGGRQLSNEEKRRLEKEDEQAASGDASFIHSQRANAAAQAHTQGVTDGNWAWSSSNIASVPSIVVQTKNSSVYYDGRGQPHIVESSTEYVTNLNSIPRTYKHYPQASANYQQSGGVGRQQQFQQVQFQDPVQEIAHNARGHIQMAAPQGSAQYERTYVSGGAPQRVQYSSSSSTSGSPQIIQYTSSSSADGSPQRIQYSSSSSSSSSPQGVQYTSSASTGGTPQTVQYPSSPSTGGSQQRIQYISSSSTGGSPQRVQYSPSTSLAGSPQAAQHPSSSSTSGSPQRVHYSASSSISGHPNGAQYSSFTSTGSGPKAVQYSSSTGGTYSPQQQQNRMGSAATYNDLSGSGSSFEKAAVGSSDFHTGILNLGTLNRGNVEQELRTHTQPHLGSNSYHQTYSSGTPQSSANHHQATSVSSSNYGGSKPYYGLENEDYYDEDYNSQAGQQNSQKWSQSSSSFQPHRRVRREEPESTETTQIDLNSPCKAANCETLRCVARNLGKDDGVWIAIRTRMVAKTMEKLAGSVPLNVSTMAVSHVTKLPYIGEPKDDIIRSHEIFYKAVPEPTPVPDVVPLWVVVLAACAGALILLLLILLLYKCGFFNRNRPTDHSMERQPLRNGYHADEHL